MVLPDVQASSLSCCQKLYGILVLNHSRAVPLSNPLHLKTASISFMMAPTDLEQMFSRVVQTSAM